MQTRFGITALQWRLRYSQPPSPPENPQLHTKIHTQTTTTTAATTKQKLQKKKKKKKRLPPPQTPQQQKQNKTTTTHTQKQNKNTPKNNNKKTQQKQTRKTTNNNNNMHADIVIKFRACKQADQFFVVFVLVTEERLLGNIEISDEFVQFLLVCATVISLYM